MKKIRIGLLALSGFLALSSCSIFDGIPLASSSKASSINGGDSSSSMSLGSLVSGSFAKGDGIIDITGPAKVYETPTYSDEEIVPWFDSLYGFFYQDILGKSNTEVIESIRKRLAKMKLTSEDIEKLIEVRLSLLGIGDSTDLSSFKSLFHDFYTEFSSFIKSTDADKLGFILGSTIDLSSFLSSGLSKPSFLSTLNIPHSSEDLSLMEAIAPGTEESEAFLAPYREIINSQASYFFTSPDVEFNYDELAVIGRAGKYFIEAILDTFSEDDLASFFARFFHVSDLGPEFATYINHFSDSLGNNPTPYFVKLGRVIEKCDFTKASYDKLVSSCVNSYLSNWVKPLLNYMNLSYVVNDMTTPTSFSLC